MIVRDARRQVVDLGPAPAHIDSVRAVETIALRAELLVSPVTRRSATADELARLDGEPERAVTMPEARRTPEQVAESRRRGGEMTAQKRRDKRLVPDYEIIRALREANGIRRDGARIVKMRTAAYNWRVRSLLARDEIPVDVREMMRPGGHRPGVPHTPETRALIAVRLKEAWAAKRGEAA